jgi:uncharacterized protein (TIGR03067 family)
MGRVIAIVTVTFVAVFGGSYVLMQRGNDTAAPPSSAPSVEKARQDGSQSKAEDGSATNETAADDTTRKQDQAPPIANKTDTSGTKRGDSTKEAKKPAASPNPEQSPTSKSNKSKRIVAQRPSGTAKPREVNGGVWDLDLDALSGTWRMVDAEYDGKRNPDEAKDYSWEFKVDKYTIKRKGNFEELWAVEVNSSRKPKTIDGTGLQTTVGPVSGNKKLMGIYELTDDTLRVCYDLTGNGRPDSFKAGNGSRRACYYFKR